MLLSDSYISMRPLWLNILFTPVDYIFVICLTKCQCWLGMVKPSPGVSFWFISLVIMCLMHSRSYNKLWVAVGILGLKSALNLVDSGTGQLEIVPRHENVGLWEHPELSRHWHAHSMGASRGLIA